MFTLHSTFGTLNSFCIINTTKGRLRHAEPFFCKVFKAWLQCSPNWQLISERKIISQAICKMIVLIPFHFPFRLKRRLIVNLCVMQCFGNCAILRLTLLPPFRCPLSVPCFYRCQMIKRTSQLKRWRNNCTNIRCSALRRNQLVLVLMNAWCISSPLVCRPLRSKYLEHLCN